MAWPPTPIDMLRELDGASETVEKTAGWFVAGPGKGLAVYDPQYLAPLIDAGMVEKVPDAPYAFYLNKKGKEALAMLKGESAFSQFSQPEWLLIELTK